MKISRDCSYYLIISAYRYFRSQGSLSSIEHLEVKVLSDLFHLADLPARPVYGIRNSVYCIVPRDTRAVFKGADRGAVPASSYWLQRRPLRRGPAVLQIQGSRDASQGYGARADLLHPGLTVRPSPAASDKGAAFSFARIEKPSRV